MIRLLILATLLIIMVVWVKYRALPMLRAKLAGQDGMDPRQAAVLSKPIDPAVLVTVLTLLAGGSKLQAISHLRRSGLGRAAAKALVDALQEGHRPPVTEGNNVTVDSERLPDLASRARTLDADGFDRDAIALVRSETGMDADAAAKFIRSLR